MPSAGEVTRLGKYTCPPKDRAGEDASWCRGSGDYGMQEDFASRVSSYLSKVNECGKFDAESTVSAVHLDMGGVLGDAYSGTSFTAGFVSSGDAAALADSGTCTFLSDPSWLAYFGYGLGLWIGKSPLVAADGTSDGMPSPDDYGLLYRKLSTGESLLTPASDLVEWKDDAATVSYDPSYERDAGTDNSDASASSSGSNLTDLLFFSNAFQSIGDAAGAAMLVGNRALANDVPVSSTVFNLCKASMRSYMAGPYGDFIAFYPDYWGAYGNQQAKVELDDIELLDFTVEMSDAEFYTHVYVPGVVRGTSQSLAYWQTTGVVSVESGADALASAAHFNEAGESVVSDEVSPILDKLLNIPDGYEWMYTPRELYRRYGARPCTSSQQLTAGTKAVESGTVIDPETGEATSEMTAQDVMPYLLALYEFMYHWANQQTCTIRTTFLPQIFPGQRLRIPSLDVTVYVKSVSHSMSYTGGFTTTLSTCCPCGTLYPGMVRDQYSATRDASDSVSSGDGGAS